MKFLPSQLMYFLQSRETSKNIRALLKFILILMVMIITFSVLFHFLMEYEGREFTWITGLYWTLTVMSTLGFGDITFTSDLGRIFSIIVLLSGVLFLLIMLPFTFITFFYAPLAGDPVQVFGRPGRCRKISAIMLSLPVSTP